MASDFTVADVLAWARTKPADEVYYYQDSFDCALCRFLKNTGRASAPQVSPHGTDDGGFWRDADGERHAYPKELEPALASQRPIYEDLWGEETFGALVKRLEALCPETPVTRSDWAVIDAYLTDIEQVSA